MKYVSLFAGIGGFDKALNDLGHECVYSNDFDKYCKIIYDKNFNSKTSGLETGGQGDEKVRKDGSDSTSQYGGQYAHGGGVALDTTSITEVKTEDIPDHDLLVGGFPCQSFSIAGKRRGFSDTRGTLFFDVARILRDKRPRYFILENVKGLLSHDGGKTFQTILGVLTDLGYEYQWQVLNSKNFGVPQNRERVFIVGHLRGEPRPQVFPIRGSATADKGQITSTTIDSNYWKGIDNHGQRTAIGTYRTHKDGNGFREMKAGISPTIPARAREDGSGQPVIAINTKQQGEPHIQKELSQTLISSMWKEPIKVFKDMRIRRLTPIECERLQGFPDNWTAGVSDTQRYKQLGNAVTVNVVKEVVKRLC